MKNFLFYLKSFLFFLFSATVTIAATAPARFQNPLKARTFEELINAIIGFLWAMAIPLGTLIIIIGAFYMATSLGNPEKFEKGKKVIFYAFIGLIVILIAQGLIPFIRDLFN